MTDIKWQEFILGELFDTTVRGTRLVEKDRVKGNTPFITAGENNNGVSAFISNNEQESFHNAITIDMFGNTFYQENEFKCDDNITVLTNEKINKFNGIYLSTLIGKTLDKYSYAYQVRPGRLKKDKILIPVNSSNNPNWKYMEEVGKNLYYSERNKIKNYLLKKISKLKLDLENSNDINLDEINWKVFKIEDIFTDIQRGKRLTRSNQIVGDIPYISSTSLNNGVDNFIGNNTDLRSSKKDLTIANSGSVGSTFYHDYYYIASDHVHSLGNDKFNKYHYLFIAVLLNCLKDKYHFNREINDQRLKNDKVILPIVYGNIKIQKIATQKYIA